MDANLGRRRSMRRIVWMLVLVTVVVAGAVAVYLVVPTYYPPLRIDGIEIWWEQTGKPRGVRGMVVDRDGKPVPNVAVNVYDDCGGGVALTDANGRFSHNLGETDVTDIEVLGARYDWPVGFGLSAADGLRFKIIDKRPIRADGK